MFKPELLSQGEAFASLEEAHLAIAYPPILTLISTGGTPLSVIALRTNSGATLTLP